MTFNIQMDGPRKRTVTEEGREIASATDHSVLDTGAAPELAISLRSVGARIRHSVSQGYRTPPSNHFVKAQSTGTIFRSMNDTLRHVHTDLPNTCTQHLDSSKKRSLVESDDIEQESESSYPQPQATRPMRPLKLSKSRFIRAPSLPTGLSSVANSDPHHMTEAKDVVEEEDWSLDMSSETAEQQFEAMDL